MQMKKIAAAMAFAGLAASGSALATNGMLLEGYGPIALGMGGAAMAYDNGTAGMANNPATLGLAADGSRLDLAVGFIGPDVNTNALGASSADAFYMPAFGYTKKSGNLAYGVGVYAQGGMGTEYPDAAGVNRGNMAQVSVGRLIFPVAYNVNKQFTIGGSIDYVWAGMDLYYPAAMIYAKDKSDFTGKMKAEGIAAKIGFTYQMNDQVTLGGTYHTASNLNDLSGGGYTMTGFDMPPMFALGLSYKANDRLQIAADVKQLMWSEVMNTPVVIYPNGMTTGTNFRQDWDDQTVIAIGASYKFSDAFTGRIGYNHGDNPIPTATVNALWPATVEDHYTLGLGYNFDKSSELNFAMSYVPKTTVVGTGAGNNGLQIEHSQFNWQLMYSMKF